MSDIDWQVVTDNSKVNAALIERNRELAALLREGCQALPHEHYAWRDKVLCVLRDEAGEQEKKATGNESLTVTCMVCGKATKGAFCSKQCRTRYNAIVRANR